MDYNEFLFERKHSSDWLTEKLPDGSTVICESTTKTVHSLDSTASAALASCAQPRSLPQIVKIMEAALNRQIGEHRAFAALTELEQAGLIESHSTKPDIRSRRDLMRSAAVAAGVIAPMVLSLTASEQKAYAQIAGSGVRPASIASISPSQRDQCAFPASFTIVGIGTHFTNSSVVTFSQSALVASTIVTANSPTSLTVSVRYFGSGAITSRVTVTTGTEVASGGGLLTVTATSACIT